MRLGVSARILVPVTLTLILPTCGGSPSGSTPPTTTPSPSPSSRPTTPPPQNLCQRLGYVSSSNARCEQDIPTFGTAVDAAIDKLMREHAEIFENGSNGLRIRSMGAYYVGILDNLNTAGLCAGFDGEEVQVKDSNDSNEQYDISSSSGYVRRSASAYLATCHPAVFPTPEPPTIPPPPGCQLPSSRELACGPDTPNFLPDIEASIDQVYHDHPEYFDFDDRLKSTDNCFKILNVSGFIDAVAAALTQRGYCARFDGEEMVIKKTNEYSEHYDITTHDNYVRRGPGCHASSCYPAAF